MRYALLPVLLLAVSPAMALATGSIECETTDGSNIAVIGNMGRERGAPLDAAILTVGDTTWSTHDAPPPIRIAHYRITDTAIMLDLIGPGSDRLELRIRINPDDASTGTLTFRGRSHPASCEFG